jgi:ABC-type transport system involved in multi-copper enzyme maturation permease subunit
MGASGTSRTPSRSLFRTLVERELRGIFASPRFVATFAVCSLLVLLALLSGTVQYRAFAGQQAALATLGDQELAEQTRWFALRPRALRAPDPLQIVATGVHPDTGRYSVVHPREAVALRGAVYEDDAILAVFRELDLDFVLQVVITLYALLLTHDAVSGERESGVLRLVLAHAVPRWKLLSAKVAGNLLGLGLPLLVPLLLGWLALLAAGVPLSGETGLRFALVLLAGMLLFAFFVVFGLMVSCLTRRAAISFLVALAAWIGMVLVLPRAGLLLAGELVPVPSAAEVDSERAGVERELLGASERAAAARWAGRRRQLQALPEAERTAYEDERLWSWMEEDEKERQAVLAEIDVHRARLEQRVRNLRQRQERLALGIAGWTPPAAFRAAAVTLATTGIDLGARYTSAIEAFREEVRRYLLVKDPAAGAITVQATAGPGGARPASVRRGDEGTEPLDLSGMPRFTPPAVSLAALLGRALPPLALLVASSLLAFGVAAGAFARYDAR